ncbi:MAG: hypothetical protein ACP5VC_16940 [Bryobacteraceae bacterium]
MRQVLEAYRKTPGTMGPVRRADRMLAAARRLIRPAGAPPLTAICSLAYFLPVIEEVLESRVSPDYFRYLRHKLANPAPAR